MLSKTDGFVLYGKMAINFFSASELPNQNMNTGYVINTGYVVDTGYVQPIFHKISHNSNASLGIVDCSVYTRLFALTDNYHQKRMELFAYTPVDCNCLEISAKPFIIFARENQFNQENFLTMLQFVELPLQSIQTLHALDRILKIHFRIFHLSADFLEFLEEVSQL